MNATDDASASLATLIATARQPLDRVLAIAAQLAEQLAELHRHGIVHHGVRPAAIRVDAATGRARLVETAEARGTATLALGGAEALACLVYAAPERTGRMEHAADHRSDLYSLGVVVHELLTGAPPFRRGDALELIHAHIAEVPVAPASLDPSLPATLSDIVMRLLAKTPDERYQSASGLAADLAECERAWAADGRIAPFPLGRRDAADHLVVGARLYGREAEVQTLLDAFERACGAAAGPSLLLVEGYSGIGKTALIQQLYRPIVRKKGYFISGKFDQLVRGIPFGALIDAFRGLVQQLLTESETKLASWRGELREALGGNGGVLAEVIPEIELIIGAQPTPAVLGATEAQNRFQRVLQNFFAALARPEHPLVVFLDDLQWADAATLGLLEPLLTGGGIPGLMLMGAHRDNELDASPRLVRTLAALDAAGVQLHRVALGPLLETDLRRLVADTLRSDNAHAARLARLVFEKTGGNPFFVIQFLKTLERDGHFHFDDAAARWGYSLEAIAAAPLADNVIDLMTRSIQRLPQKSQFALTMAACIGNRFDTETLALVCEQSLAATGEDIEQAQRSGLVVESAGDFSFLHDRVQQAAYALIPLARRERVHLTVGRLLQSRAPSGQADAALFDVVHHLNLGRALIADEGERREVARLNLGAGRRAKSSTAHETALELFQTGVGLLEASAWQGDYALAFALHLEAAESLYLCGQFAAAQDGFTALIARAATPIDRARVVRLRSVQYENQARYADALASARDGLAPLGVLFPEGEDEKAAALDAEIEAIEALRGRRDIGSLIELPVMADERVRMVASMLTDMWSAAYIIGDPTLARLISATLVRLSLEFGNVEESAYGYVTHAITVGPVRGDYEAAYAYGRLALDVNERFGDLRRRAKIHQQFHAHVNFWCRPYASCIAHAREACRAGLESGDFLYAAYGAGTEPWAASLATQDLTRFVAAYAPSVALIEKLKNPPFADSVRVLVNGARALQGLTAARLSLSDPSLDEEAWLRSYGASPFFASIHAVVKLQLAVLLGSRGEALAAARHSALWAPHTLGTIWPVVHEFWHALALAASHADLATDERATDLAALRDAQAAFAARAVHSAENFLCQANLISAEIAAIEGRDTEAITAYERAIEFAASSRQVALQALAHELCGRFRSTRGDAALGLMHLAQARDCYARWGASAKVEAMVACFPGPGPAEEQTASLPIAGLGRRRAEVSSPAALPAVAESAADLDLFSVLKATLAVAGEVEVDVLFDRLMRIAIENAGADRGSLVLEDKAGPQVHSVAARHEAAPRHERGVALALSVSVPIGVVNYVRRTGASVVLAQAETDDRHGTDPYIATHRPRSLLCLPVQNQGRSVGTLYLENRSVGAAFSDARVRIMRILATQAAVALENAYLFTGLKNEIDQRQRAQEDLGRALDEVERLKENLEVENSFLRRDLIANVSHDLRTPLVSMRGYLEVLVSKGESLLAEQRHSYTEIALRQSERLGHLIDQLFELAKLDFKGMTLQREPFAFAELAADVSRKFQLAADGQRIALVVEAEGGLPFVDADLSLIERVLENLIGNALKHTPPGGRVSVRARREGARVLAQVADSGRGIAEKDLPFVFDRFYRAEGERRGAAGGAGLGLAIARRIVELHGGSMGVASRPGDGACFSFALPVGGAARSENLP